MADYKIPELPSDDELGITDEDREQYGDEPGGPTEGELSKDELRALLGDDPAGRASKSAEPKSGRKKRTKAKKEKRAKVAPGASAETAPGAGLGSRAGAGAGGRRRGPLTLVLLVALAAASSTRLALPRPVPTNAPDTVFSSGRAMSTVVEMARAPHPTGSPEHARVRDYLVERLRSLGLEPEVQTTTSVIERGTAARAATVRNVLARIPGTAPTGAVLITAHYDSRELAPGAGDDATGVAAILEAVRALGAGPPARNDIIVLLSDSEELGLLGARAFVSEHPWLTDVSVVLSFEMRGAAGASIMFETADQNGWVVRALSELDPRPVANSLALEVYRRLPNDTDFTPFREAGKQGLNFAAIGRGDVYHQSTDTPAHLSEATLQHHGIRALAALRWFGDADLTVVDAPNVVYFSVPLLGLIVYDASWVLPVAGGLLAGLALLVLVALRGGARGLGVLGGLAVAVVEGALAYGAGVALLRWSARFHPEAGSLSAALYHSEGWYVLALAATVFAVVVGLHALAARWLRADELLLGGLVMPAGLALWMSYAWPLGAMNLQWPVISAILAGLLLIALRARAAGWAGWTVAVLLAVPVVVMLAPVTELLWITLTLVQASALALLMATALWLCVPMLGFLRQPNAWWSPVLALAVAGAAFAFANMTAGASAEHPAPSTLLYAYEHGDPSGLWVTAPTPTDSADVTPAVAPGGAAFDETRVLAAFGLPGERSVADAPSFPAPLPEVVLLSDVTMGVARRVQIGVRSRIGAEMLALQVDPNTATRVLAINGRTLEGSDSLAWIEHWGVPDSLVTVDVLSRPGGTIGLHVVEHLLRPGEIVGPEVFRRPPERAPDVSTQSDRAVFRSSLGALLDTPPAAGDSVTP
ncbi:MAG: M28 family peptidase [Gemmatimonadales bacterium]